MWSTPLVLPDFPGEVWKLWNKVPKYKILFSNQGRFAYDFNNGYVKKLKIEDKNTDRSNNDDVYPSFIKNKKKHYAHRIIYEMFIGPIPSGMIVHHKNNNKQKAYLENLELVTMSKNSEYAHDDGRYDNTKVARIPIKINDVEYSSSYDASKKLGINSSTIRSRIKNDKWPSYECI
jgi:hypothetical protein